MRFWRMLDWIISLFCFNPRHKLPSYDLGDYGGCPAISFSSLSSRAFLDGCIISDRNLKIIFEFADHNTFFNNAIMIWLGLM